MPEKTEWTAVYLADGDGEPAALFRDGHHANEFRRTSGDARTVVSTVELSVPADAGVKDVLASTAPASGRSGVEAAEDVYRATVRSELVEERRREQVRKEVAQELDEADREQAKSAGSSSSGSAAKTADSAAERSAKKSA